ncbi:MAG: 30S ribosomal protein S4 [Pelagibacterales bacterium]|nr:30S ribosomal protein S4 [Pelagibacterales bacterium]
MSKRSEPHYKIDRRLGCNLWGRPKSPFNKREYAPGQHGQRRSKLSDFGIQLHAKQKLKGYYGNMSERQFRSYYASAVRLRGDTGEKLVGLLERRLDAIVYRLNFAPTIFSARQLINHGHITVNNKRVNIRSYLCSVGDKIAVKQSSQSHPLVMESIQGQYRDIPEYIQADIKNMEGSLVRVPILEDIPYPIEMQPNLVVEFYSR